MSFKSLNLLPSIVDGLTALGYEKPTPVQEQSIPLFLEGRDLLAKAQTGTGKTAAFALPILSQIDLSSSKPQCLVLAPTRELAIQIAEAFQTYAKSLKGFHVLPIYGGADFQPQLRGLKRGAHVIVGTPGRVMDHIERKTLKLETVNTVILDEADEMLKMGFLDDVKFILDQAHENRQTGLFSATMPTSIQRIADKYLKNPAIVQINATQSSIKTIAQKYVQVDYRHKLEALSRFLEIEEFEAIIIFCKTRIGTIELTEKLQARGYAAQAINGDLAQKQREQVIKRLKGGQLDIIVATDVAARGLDVDRIDLVVNYDLPHDVESYVHRIGRTGRAGRKGQALLFVGAREKRMLREIEHATKAEVERIKIPTLVELKQNRMQQLNEQINQEMLNDKISQYKEFASELIEANELKKTEIIASMISLLLKQEDVDSNVEDINSQERERDSRDGPRGGGRSGRGGFRRGGRDDRGPRRDDRGAGRRDDRRDDRRRDRRDERGEGRIGPSRGGPRRDDRGPRRDDRSESRGPRRDDRRDAPRPNREFKPSKSEGGNKPVRKKRDSKPGYPKNFVDPKKKK